MYHDSPPPKKKTKIHLSKIDPFISLERLTHVHHVIGSRTHPHILLVIPHCPSLAAWCHLAGVTLRRIPPICRRARLIIVVRTKPTRTVISIVKPLNSCITACMYITGIIIAHPHVVVAAPGRSSLTSWKNLASITLGRVPQIIRSAPFIIAICVEKSEKVKEKANIRNNSNTNTDRSECEYPYANGTERERERETKLC